MHQLDQILHAIEDNHQGQNKLPPVQSWQPDKVGEIDIHINTQGKWLHEGDPFEKQALVRLFSTILRFEKGFYYLVTPVEKLLIHVDDVPFIIDNILPSAAGEQANWILTTQCGDSIVLDESAEWELRQITQMDGTVIHVPYVRIRHELWARLSRHVFYQMVDIALESNDITSLEPELFFESAGHKFSLGKLED